MIFNVAPANGALAHVDNSVGSYGWVDVNNVLANDNAYAQTTMYIDNMYSGVLRRLQPVVDGLITGTNQATDNSLVPGTGITIGSNSNMFGLTGLTREQVMAEDFGFAVTLGEKNGGTLVGETNYIVVTGFGFKIPKGSTPVGMRVLVHAYQTYAGPGIEYARVAWVQAVIYYSWTPVLIGSSGPSNSFIIVEGIEEQEIPQNKEYQYLAYEDNVFRGQWPDVQSIPSLKLNINELPGELPVTLARNLDSAELETDEIELSGYSGEVLVTTQNNETILASDNIAYGVGSGTDLEVNHTVKVKEYYGGYEGLLTHDGEQLLTSQLEPLVVPNGYPRGRMYYHGYVSDFGLVYANDTQNTLVKLLHTSEEMNNVIYRTPDTLKRTTYDISQNLAYGFNGDFSGKWPGETVGVGFTFQATATYKLQRIVVAMSGWRDNVITMIIRSGSTMGAGTILGTATAQITTLGINKLSFSFPIPADLVNTSYYNVEFISAFEKQTGSQTMPAWLYVGSNYADGTNYVYQDGAWVAANSSYDIGFELWEQGGDTRVNELSVAPSTIMKKVLDYGKLQGNLITYDLTSIQDTFTIVSAPFNTNTLKEAADYVLKLAPSNWFWFIDPGQLLFNLKGQPEVVSQWFTLKKDIIRLELHKNIENIINDVLFTGGGNPALFREHVDAASQTQWRKGLAKPSDNRVTDNNTADIIMEGMTEQQSQPIWLGTVEILRAEHPKMVLPGQLTGFRNVGGVIEAVTVLVVSVNVTPDKFTVDLGARIPKTSQRIEDIKRNLTRIELENNPSEPSV